MLANRAEARDTRWFTYDRSYRAWAVLSAEAAVDAAAPAGPAHRLADTAPQLILDGAARDVARPCRVLTSRGIHSSRAADLCTRAAMAARTDAYSASDRLDIIARAADIASAVFPELGRQLFDQAVGAATGINDDAAQLLAVHADLAMRAAVMPGDRPSTATCLIAAAEAVAPHVSDERRLPYARSPAEPRACTQQPARRREPVGRRGETSRWRRRSRPRCSEPSTAARSPRSRRWSSTTSSNRTPGGCISSSTSSTACGRRSGEPGVRPGRARPGSEHAPPDVSAGQQPELAHQLLDRAEGLRTGRAHPPALEPVVALSQDPDQPSTADDDRWKQPPNRSQLRKSCSMPQKPVLRHARRGRHRPSRGECAWRPSPRFRRIRPRPPRRRLDRVDMLNAVASLPANAEAIVLEVLADRVRGLA